MKRRFFARFAILMAAVLLSSCGGGGASVSPSSGTAPPANVSATPTPTPSATPMPASGTTNLALTPGLWAPTNLPLNVTAAVASQNLAIQAPLPLNVSNLGTAPPSTVGALHLQLVQGLMLGKSTSRNVTRDGRAVNAFSRAPRYCVASPTDLQYYGGAVLSTAVSHNIFVTTNYTTCSISTCWGPYGPTTVESALSTTNWIHYIDQYVGSNAANRYTAGSSYAASINLGSRLGGYANPVVGLDSLLYMIYVAGVQSGYNGYGHIFHVILPPGIDTCMDLSSSCYSPDHLSTHAFCAFHSAVSYGGLKYLFTIEPYQDVIGCQTYGPSLAGSNDETDSTASTLAHELIETITDPDVGTAWMDPANSEVGDRCQSFKANVSSPPYVYGIQFMYSDVDHNCIGG